MLAEAPAYLTGQIIGLDGGMIDFSNTADCIVIVLIDKQEII